MREIIFDTETTGLDPNNGDRMVEIGCIEMINRVATGATFHCYFNPERDMPAEAERVHGLSISFLADKPLFATKAAELLEFLGDSPLVAHNAGFDMGFLNAELARAGFEPVDRDRMIDTVRIARQKHPGAKNSLDALCSRYGVDRSHRTLHGALLDAELLAQVYVELLGGRQMGMELAPENAPFPTATGVVAASSAAEPLVQAAEASRPVRPARPHAPSAQELEAHQAFIQKLKEPLWLN